MLMGHYLVIHHLLPLLKIKTMIALLGMYHDALQSGLKAFGFDRGVTVQGGLPVPITTPSTWYSL